MNKTDKSFLDIRDLVVEYTSGGRVIHAVNGVSLHLQEGGALGLVGETGAGKTTIAKAILGVLPDPPAKIKNGQIMLDGEDLLQKSDKEMREVRGSRISMIFQDPMTALNPVMSVGDQILEVILLHNKISKAEGVIKTKEMLEMVGIPAQRYGEYPHQFSGGMKQRVVIAMALACDPKLLLADEPTTALDVTIQAQVLDMIRELRNKYNSAMILITHDLGVVAEMCEEVAVIYAGEIVEYGSKRNIFKETAHPYTIGLFDSVPHMEDESERLKPIPGLPPDPSELPKGCAFSPRCPYASDKCRAEKPDMTMKAEGHLVRCFYPQNRGKENS